MMKQFLYQAPELELIEVNVEQGFAGSIDPNPNDPTDDPVIPDNDTEW